MIVIVGRKGVSLAECRDMTRFSVGSFALDLDAVAKELGRAGFRPWIENDHVWLLIERLRGEITPDDRAAFDAMIRHARGLEFVSPDGEHVRAHVKHLHRDADTDEA